MHIFVSRRNYRNVQDNQSGKRRKTAVRLSVGNPPLNWVFAGSLSEWGRLMGAMQKR